MQAYSKQLKKIYSRPDRDPERFSSSVHRKHSYPNRSKTPPLTINPYDFRCLFHCHGQQVYRYLNSMMRTLDNNRTTVVQLHPLRNLRSPTPRSLSVRTISHGKLSALGYFKISSGSAAPALVHVLRTHVILCAVTNLESRNIPSSQLRYPGSTIPWTSVCLSPLQYVQVPEEAAYAQVLLYQPQRLRRAHLITSR